MFLNEQINKGINGWNCVCIIDVGVCYTNRLDSMMNSCPIWIKASFSSADRFFIHTVAHVCCVFDVYRVRIGFGHLNT